MPVLFGAAAVLIAWVLWPPPSPRILSARPVTRGLRTSADNMWASDGTRLYYSDYVNGVTKYYQIPIAGGEPTEIPIPFPYGNIIAYLPRRGALLINGSDTQDTPDGLPLWLASVPSGGVRRLGDLKAWFATASPDEEQLALVYGVGGEPRIGLAKADGSGLHELLKLPSLVGGWLAWAPGGQRLRFGSSGPVGHEGEAWIWETSVRGEAPRPLWPGGLGQWTRDGRYFVFARPQSSAGWSRSDLWAVRDGPWLPWPRPRPVPLSSGPMSLFTPVFGPDGRLFAWGDLPRGELLRYDASSRRVEKYIGGLSGQFVDPSPDSQSLVFVTYPEGELWRSRPDGREKRQLTAPGLWAAQPHWSPDGRTIAFVGQGPGEDRMSLRRVSADGSGEEVLVKAEPGGNIWGVCWLPEGEGLLFSYFEARHPGVFKLDLDTKEVSLLPGAQTLRHPKCSRQGDVLAAEGSAGSTRRIRWRGRADWEEVDLRHLVYPNWTRDGQAIIGLNNAEGRVERLTLKTRAWTTVVDLAGTPLVATVFVPWMGLATDDAPLVLRDHGTRELYAFDLDPP